MPVDPWATRSWVVLTRLIGTGNNRELSRHMVLDYVMDGVVMQVINVPEIDDAVIRAGNQSVAVRHRVKGSY